MTSLRILFRRLAPRQHSKQPTRPAEKWTQPDIMSSKCCSFQYKRQTLELPINKSIEKQELTSVGLTYIHSCRSYVHTQRDFTNGASLASSLGRRISTIMFACGWAWPARRPIRLILGFWGSKVDNNVWFFCLGRRWTAVQNLTPLALSSAEKSVTVQTHKKKQTNSNRYIHTLLIGNCG